MRYFKVFDEISPEGQIYRLNGVVLEAQNEDGSFSESIWFAFFGEAALGQLVQYTQNFSDARMEDVECPES